MARFIDVDNMRAILAELDAAFQQVRPDIARAREIGAQPKEVVFVEEIPRNPTGKILKRILRETIL